MARDPNCVFCKIIAAQIPSAVIFEDQYILSFLDIGPLAEGHLLVIPRDHYPSVTTAPPAVLRQLGSVLPLLSRVCLQVTGAQGINILLNQGSVAGQSVEHIHFHVIPRKEGDGLGYRWNPGKYVPGRDTELAAEYQKAIVKQQTIDR